MYSLLLGDHDKREGGYRVNSLEHRLILKRDTLIEEIENLEPHHGLVIEGPADIADQLRIVSSQGEPALPVLCVGDGARAVCNLARALIPSASCISRRWSCGMPP